LHRHKARAPNPVAWRRTGLRLRKLEATIAPALRLGAFSSLDTPGGVSRAGAPCPEQLKIAGHAPFRCATSLGEERGGELPTTTGGTWGSFPAVPAGRVLPRFATGERAPCQTCVR